MLRNSASRTRVLNGATETTRLIGSTFRFFADASALSLDFASKLTRWLATRFPLRMVV